MKTTQQAIKTAPCRISLSVAVLFGYRGLLLFSVVTLAESYISECCVDESKEGEMTKVEKRTCDIYWQAWKDGDLGVSTVLHMHLANAGKLLQLSSTFSSSLAAYMYTPES